MSTIKKPTFRENYTALLNMNEVKANPALVEFINGRIEALDKKSASAKGKTSKVAKENVGIKETLLEVLSTHDTALTISELLKAHPTELGEFSNQKVSALFRQMIAEGTVVNEKVKGKSLFAVAPSTDTDEE